MGENVKDLLEELKNLSELMLDLAYSSVFFNNKEIAQEVSILFEHLEELEEKLYLHLFAASRGKVSRKLISFIDLVEATKLVASAAKQLSQVVIEGVEVHPIIKEALEESDESITKAVVKKKSIMTNKTLGNLKLRTEMGIDIIAIRRGKNWIFDPDKNTQLKEKDVIIAVGPKNSCKKLRGLAHGGVKNI